VKKMWSLLCVMFNVFNQLWKVKLYILGMLECVQLDSFLFLLT
jgi:hypothetical protein